MYFVHSRNTCEHVCVCSACQVILYLNLHMSIVGLNRATQASYQTLWWIRNWLHGTLVLNSSLLHQHVHSFEEHLQRTQVATQQEKNIQFALNPAVRKASPVFFFYYKKVLIFHCGSTRRSPFDPESSIPALDSGFFKFLQLAILLTKQVPVPAQKGALEPPANDSCGVIWVLHWEEYLPPSSTCSCWTGRTGEWSAF